MRRPDRQSHRRRNGGRCAECDERVGNRDIDALMREVATAGPFTPAAERPRCCRANVVPDRGDLGSSKGPEAELAV